MQQMIASQEMLADAIRAARRERGLSQAELARRLQVDRTTVVRMEATGTVAAITAIRALSELGYAMWVSPKSMPPRQGDDDAEG